MIMNSANKRSIEKTQLIVFLSCLAVTCTQAGIVMYTPSIPTLITIFNTSYSEIAHTLTAYIFGYATSVLILGGISDQIGVKKSYLITTAIFVVSSLALAITRQIDLFILLRFLQGFGGGGCAVIARTSAKTVFSKKELVKAMSWISFSFVLSMGIFQYIGGLVQTYGNYRYDFLIMSLLGIIIFTLIILFFNDRNDTIKKPLDIQQLSKNYLFILKQNYLLPLAIGGGLGYSVLLAFNVLGVYYLHTQLHISAHQIGLIGIIFSMAYLLGSFLTNRFIKAMDINALISLSKKIILFSTILFFAGILVEKNSLTMIILPISINLIGQSLLYPCAMAKALEPYEKIPGSATALFGFIQQFCGFLTSLLIAQLPNQSIFSLGFIIALTCLLNWVLLSKLFLYQKNEMS